jgi:MFS family permease
MTGHGSAGQRHDRGLVLSLAWLVMVAVANTGSTAVAQPTIQVAFDLRPVDVGWVVFGYTGTFAISTAWYGAISRRVGASRAIAFGASVLGLGALIAASAGSFEVLLAARLVQGLGAGAIPTLAFAIAGERFDSRRRARAIGVIVAGVGVGQAAGPLLGGILVDLVSWRGAIAVGGLALPGAVAVHLLHRSPRHPGLRLDLLGGFSLAMLIACGTWLLNRAPIRGADPQVLLVAAVFAAMCWFWVSHLRRRPDAFLPARILLQPGFPCAASLAALLLAVFTAVLTGLPLVAGGDAGLRGILIGLLMLPMAVTIALLSANSQRISERLGVGRGIQVGLSVLALATLLAAVSASGDSLWLVAVGLVPVGVAYGMLASPLTERVSALFPVEDRSVALGTYNVCFFVGGAIGGSFIASMVDLTLPTGVRGYAMGLLLLGALCLVALLPARRMSEPEASSSAP